MFSGPFGAERWEPQLVLETQQPTACKAEQVIPAFAALHARLMNRNLLRLERRGACRGNPQQEEAALHLQQEKGGASLAWQPLSQ